MALPKLDLPKYKHFLVGVNKKISFRPFTVKEQKILLHAKESNDIDQQLEAIQQIIDLCTDKNIKGGELSFFDVEDLFLRIRAKSVGEVIELMYKDKETNKKYKVKINLDEIKVTIPDGHSTKIQLTNKIGIVLKYPTMKLLANCDLTKETSRDDMLLACVDYVYDDSEMYFFKDISDSEKLEWFDTLDAPSLLKIKHFFDTMPRLRHEVKIKLDDDREEVIKFEGLESFFI